MTDSTCKIADCDAPKKIRGLCHIHYDRAAWHGTLENIADPVRPTLAQTRGPEVLALWDTGLNMAGISRATGITHPTVRAILIKMGVQDPVRKR